MKRAALVFCLLVSSTSTVAYHPYNLHPNTHPVELKMTCDSMNAPTYDPTDSQLLKTPATIQYVSKETQIVRLRGDTSGMDSGMEGVIWEPHKVWIHNGRGRDKTFSLSQHGFALVCLSEPQRLDYFNSDVVLDEYYPTCETLLREYYQRNGETVRVVPFDHNIRQQQQQRPAQQQTQEPIAIVHGDYTTHSAPRRLELLAQPPKQNDVWRERLGTNPLISKELAEECTQGKRRYAFVNVWKSIDANHSVQSMPLACMDMKSLRNNDSLRTLELIYADRIGENFLVTHDDSHAWWYFHEMTFSECLLIQQWDSNGKLDFCAHSAFDDPSTPDDAVPRASIEVRCLVVWDQ